MTAVGVFRRIDVASFTGGPNDPSARLRVRQYIPHLERTGIAVTEHPLPFGSVPPRNKAAFLPWGVATVAQRSAVLLRERHTDIMWICRQILPAYYNLRLLARKPMVLDVDDAVWMSRGGHRIQELARRSSVIVCGNSFLADRFRAWNSNIVIIPTAVDTEVFRPRSAAGGTEIRIGWTGTSTNFPYLYSVEKSLLSVLRRHAEVKLVVVADKRPAFSSIPRSRVEFVRWSVDHERRALSSMSIGIMPLQNSDWARGKCAYKMLCYMAHGIPVVVSPVGMNAELLAKDQIGFGPATPEEWIESLSTLIRDESLRKKMGHAGRSLAETEYSATVLSRKYAAVFRKLASGTSER